MERNDILQDNNGSIIIENSDLQYGLSDEQHIQDTINCAPGWWKENFADGVNIRSYLKSSGKEQFLSRKIKIELEKDLYTVSVPRVEIFPNGKMIIEPNATI